MINVIQIPILKDNYTYLIIDKKKNITACIDPGSADEVINILEENNLKLNFILNTHHHKDHVGGNLKLKDFTKCKVVGSEKDKLRIPGIDILLKDQEKFSIGDSEFIVYYVPGHTSGDICFYFYDDHKLFCGDSLFSLGCGRIFEGDYKEMWNSLKKLRSLSRKTLIYCGHEYTLSNAKFALSLSQDNLDLKKKVLEIQKLRKNGISTIPSILHEERKFNPFLRVDEELFLKNVNLYGLKDWEVFREIRKMKDVF